MVRQALKNLSKIWAHSDSQPTEITLAVVNVFLTHIAIGNELGGLYFERVFIILSGLYQLYCVSREDINCRVKASMVTFGVYLSTLITYLICLGLPTPSHYGWLILVVASFGSMRRLILEKLHRN